MMMTLIPVALFAALMLAAAISDGWRYVIPNWIVVALILSFFLCAAAGLIHVAMWPRILAAAVVLAVGTGIFALGLMGGGDVKLWAAVALWLGPDLLGPHVILVALLGGVVGAALLVLRKLRRSPQPVRRSFVPYGIPIAVGALLLLPHLAGATAYCGSVAC